MTDRSLAGRVALITGGGGAGMGHGLTLGFARAGARVAVGARADQERAEKVTAEARALGVEAITVMGDLSEPDTAARVVERVTSEFGPIDILMHCVGYRKNMPLVDVPIEEWRRTLDANCSSLFYLSRLVLPGMMERGWGRIVAIGGTAATRPTRNHAAVAVAKAGVVALCKTIAAECGEYGVTANVVSPAVTEGMPAASRTPERLKTYLPIPRPARFEEIATACVFLASDDAAYTTGQILRVDGGLEL